MPKPPKKIIPRNSKDIRDVLREMSQHPTGMPRKVPRTPRYTPAEKAEIERALKKVLPIHILKNPEKLTYQQLDNVKEELSKIRGRNIALSKEILWKELKTPPKSGGPVKTVFLSKNIPTRQELENAGYRAVKYRGQTVFLSPAQIKEIKKIYGDSEPMPRRTMYEQITNITPERRALYDKAAAKEAIALDIEARNSWKIQQKDAKLKPQLVRDPVEGLNKTSPISAKAEAYAERLFQKAYKVLTPNERKSIKMIIEEEARRAAKAAASVVGRKNIRRDSFLPTSIPLGGIGSLGGGLIDQIK